MDKLFLVDFSGTHYPSLYKVPKTTLHVLHCWTMAHPPNGEAVEETMGGQHVTDCGAAICLLV